MTASYHRLGAGSDGRVFRAVGKDSNNKFAALKFLRAREEQSREAEVLRRVQGHPNVIELLGVYRGAHAGQEHMVLAFPELDSTLWEFLGRRGAGLDLRLGRQLAGQVMFGLGHVHQQGCVRRDISFTNVLLAYDTGSSAGWTAKFADFSRARCLPESAPPPLPPRRVPAPVPPRRVQCTAAPMTRDQGAVAYAAPELLFAAASSRPCYGPAADVWSAGAVCFEMRFWSAPWPGKRSDDPAELIAGLVARLGLPRASSELGGHEKRYALSKAASILAGDSVLATTPTLESLRAGSDGAFVGCLAGALQWEPSERRGNRVGQGLFSA